MSDNELYLLCGEHDTPEDDADAINALNVKSGCMIAVFHMATVLTDMMMILLVQFASSERSVS